MDGYTEVPGAAMPEGAEELVNRVMLALLPLRLDTAHVITSTQNLPVGVRHLIGTENSNEQPAAEFEQRRGRCFELSGWGIVFGGVVPKTKTRLVHGSIQGRGEGMERIGHAWLMLPEHLVWEPATSCFYDEAAFYSAFSARDEISYTWRQAMQNMLRTENFGSWHGSRYPAEKPTYQYTCNAKKCTYETNTRVDIKNHAAILGHHGWTDREAPND